MEQRRFRALTLLEKGLSQAAVARRTKVSRQSVLRWNRQRLEGGKDALRAAGRAGRKPGLEPEQEQELVKLLVAGPEAAGFSTPLWTLERVARVIRREFGLAGHATTALRVLRDRLGWSCQKPVGAGRWSGMKRPSPPGSASPGRRLKKSPRRRPHDRLHRRERADPEAASRADQSHPRARRRCSCTASTGRTPVPSPG